MEDQDNPNVLRVGALDEIEVLVLFVLHPEPDDAHAGGFHLGQGGILVRDAEQTGMNVINASQDGVGMCHGGNQISGQNSGKPDQEVDGGSSWRASWFYLHGAWRLLDEVVAEQRFHPAFAFAIRPIGGEV